MHHAVALGAVGVGGVLQGDVFAGQLAVGIKSRRVPAPGFAAAFHQAGTQQRGRVGPAKQAGPDGFDAGLVIGRVQVAQEAVHLQHARLAPIPGCRLAGDGVEHGRLRVGGIWRQAAERLAAARSDRRAAAHDALAVGHQPGRGTQVKERVTFCRKVAVGERIPFAEQAGAGIPGPAVLG